MTHKKNSPTPEAANLAMTGLHTTEILLVCRSNTPTPGDVNLTMAGLCEMDIPSIPAPTHIPTQPHPGAPSSSFPPQQLLQASSDDIEDDKREELGVTDITSSIANSDSESTTSKSLNSTNVNSNSIPTRQLEREHVKTIYSPMRRGTKQSIDGNWEAAGEGNREEDEQVEVRRLEPPTSPNCAKHIDGWGLQNASAIMSGGSGSTIRRSETTLRHMKRIVARVVGTSMLVKRHGRWKQPVSHNSAHPHIGAERECLPVLVLLELVPESIDFWF
ncbi:hypothetical protein F5J12DRAFT_915389 [Pisolithus orientalis]|uniref:uncharacterized protein n=1 Tax=Pisolithus orientalis TaxID=936130 RepID=UPI00222459CC|nr:uncharacterized protein F5J12DRAFT_915389 [Pisolithus orientalis]KAI5993132.1 hypothetical protein F5J12DRAFT_915389 [Pisolithus orientalis]